MNREVEIEIKDKRLSIKGLDGINPAIVNKLYYIINKASLTIVKVSTYKETIRFSNVTLSGNAKASVTNELLSYINKVYTEKELEHASGLFKNLIVV